jgi:hypothetical protein
MAILVIDEFYSVQAHSKHASTMMMTRVDGTAASSHSLDTLFDFVNNLLNLLHGSQPIIFIFTGITI